MMLSVLLIALLQYSVAGQDCSANLVQALQQCATSIQGNEPLAEQQKKCAPNGCNYDCPSLNVLDTLEAKFTALQQMVTNNTQRFQSLDALEVKFMALQQMVTNNTEKFKSLDALEVKFAALEQMVVNQTKDIVSLDTKVDDLHDYCGAPGWTRVAYLDMFISTEECPSDFRTYDVNGVRACGRQITSGGSCNSVTYSTDGVSYSQVCGRVIGYQYGSTDASVPYHGTGPGSHNDINQDYVDGVSITRGSPRQHVWTFISNNFESINRCPCNYGSTYSTQSFVGEDYFCETGVEEPVPYQLYTDDILWDGDGCGGNEGPCCHAPGIPWFHKVFNTTTTDDIEIRTCCDEGTSNEDAAIALYEIYIK